MFRKILKPKTDELHQIKKERTSGLLYSLFFLIFLVSVLLITFSINHKSNIEKMSLDQEDELDAIEETIHNYLQDTIGTILIFDNSKHARTLLMEEDGGRWDLLSDIFYSIIAEARIFNQIRLIDVSGMEIVRVDREIDGTFKIIPIDDLQYKGDRYYFTETINSPIDHIYISPFDLNVEHGEIEMPHKPIIRVAKAIRNDNDDILGMMVINVLGQQLLNDIHQQTIHEGDKIYLLNEKGYYLHNDDSNNTFGFMFNDERNRGFLDDYPELWENIQSGHSYINDSSGRYYIKKIQLAPPGDYKTHDEYYYIIMHVPSSQLIQLDEHLVKSIFYSFWIFSPFMITVGWLLGSQLSRNKYYRFKLEESASRDGMTGLYNHKTIINMLQQNIELSRRRNEPLSVVFIDINNLKYVNDNYGHDMGDKMILSAAKSFTDVVRHSDLVSRLGGDEFLLVFPNCNTEDAFNILQRAQELFRASGIKEMDTEWNMSYGCTTLLENETYEELISRSDKLMYEHKKKTKIKL